MRKKKLLFLCSNMNIGGFQKSLISVLQCFDYDRYEVDLLLFNPAGIFRELIPEQVNVLTPGISADYFATAPEAVLALLRQGHIGLACRRLLSAAVGLLDKGHGAKFLSRGIPAVQGQYDAAIDYNGQHILYYMVERVKADRKISFFHSDYKQWPYYKQVDRVYYDKVDAIVTVSDLCVASMREVFPNCEDKIHCIENIISLRSVRLYPQGANGYQDDFQGTRLVSVGRACRDKGIYLAIEACALLRQWGHNVRWYWVGPWDNEVAIRSAIKEKGLEQDFVLLGATNNPYDYMSQAKLVVHPSYFEGKSVAIEEAKVLGRPVVATNFSTVGNQIEDGKTGLIVDIDPEAIADGIRRLLENCGLYEAVRKNLEPYRTGNESEIEKLYRLIEG